MCNWPNGYGSRLLICREETPLVGSNPMLHAKLISEIFGSYKIMYYLCEEIKNNIRCDI